MEVVGAIASSLALAGAAAQVSKRASAFYHDLKDTPSDLESLKSNLRHTQRILDQMAGMRVRGFIPLWCQQTLEECLVDIEKAITQVQDDYKKFATRQPGKRVAVKWALANKHLIENAERRMQSPFAYVNTLPQLVELQETHSLGRRITEAETVISSLQQLHLDIRTTQLQASSLTNTGGNLPKQIQLNNSEAGNNTQSPLGETWTFKLAPWLLFLGVRGSVVSFSSCGQKRVSISIRFHLPFSRRQKHPTVLTADLILHVNQNPWRVYPSASRGLATARLIPQTADIVLACLTGDLGKTQNLLATGRASLFDLTLDNMTLLSYAITGGNPEIVRLLLAEGADPNWTFEKDQTSALQWALYRGRLDMALMLANAGADPDHISALGWYPMFYLLEGARLREFSSTHIPTLPSMPKTDAVSFHLEVREIKTPTATSGATTEKALWLRAGYSSRPGELDFSSGYELSRRSSPSSCSTQNKEGNVHPDVKLSWKNEGTPIYLAICSNNLPLFKTLLPYYMDNIDESDGRGLSMLDYAARNGRGEIVKYLLDQGSDHSYIEPPAPDDDETKTRLSSDYIAPWTAETYTAYLGILLEYRLIEIREEIDDDGSLQRDIYWVADEDWYM